MTKDAENQLGVVVKRNGVPLSLEALSFRILMEPGRLRWDDGKLFYSSTEAGSASVTVDVFVPPSVRPGRGEVPASRIGLGPRPRCGNW